MELLKSRLSVYAYLFLGMFFFFRAALATEISSSIWSGIGEDAHGDNGTLIIGINSKTKTMSGYYESSDRTGNVTAECKFHFAGKLEGKIVDVRIVSVHPDFIHGESEPISGKVEVQPNSGKPTITIYPYRIPPSCDWLYNGLPSYVVPKSFKLKDGLPNEFERTGNWQGVCVIRSKRAYFHSQPTESSKGKVFVVTGDLIYTYDENPAWYYAKYRGDKKETVGWIKKTDVVHVSEQR